MQRAAIARALAGGPEILLADEPTGNLDSRHRAGGPGAAPRLEPRAGLTMMMVTHDLQIAQQADRVVRLAEGRIEEWAPSWPEPSPESADAGGHRSAGSSPGRSEPPSRMSPKVYIGGKLYEKADAKISVFDHGLLYGDGIFEGIRSYAGNVFRLKAHVDRLYDSAKADPPGHPDVSKEEMARPSSTPWPPTS